jgi:DNA-binding transcriptional LysR family regulator
MFDHTLLRSFVAVAETQSFTRAAELVDRSQPTVSQQIQRLEEAAGRILVQRDTRSVTLTHNGEAMLGFARKILAAQDEAVAYFTGSAMYGRLRFGSADDLASSHLAQILRDFRQSNPRLNLELSVNQSGALTRRLNAGQLDLVYIKQEPGLPDGRVVRRDHLVWVAQRDIDLDPARPVPLIAYQAPSLSRTAAIKALEDSGRTWRITCHVREINGVLAAARAGIGVAVVPRSLVPADLAPVPAAAGLPLLGEVDFALLTNPRAPREPVEALIAALLRREQPRSVEPAGL